MKGKMCLCSEVKASSFEEGYSKVEEVLELRGDVSEFESGLDVVSWFESESIFEKWFESSSREDSKVFEKWSSRSHYLVGYLRSRSVS